LEKLGVAPKPQQIDVLESIYERRDCVLIAPTGWGKTLAFTLPLLLLKDAVIIVITPLKVLGEEQSGKLKNLNINSINITEDDKEINAAKVLQGGYRAIFVSPEMLLESNRLKGLWENKKWRESIRAVVVDEAHCINAWGKMFRRAFDELARLRYKLDARTPFLATSATLPPTVLAQTILSLDMENPTCINVGNDRPNIMYKVKQIRKPVSKFEDLRFLRDKVRTIVYFDNRDLAEEAGHTIRTWIGQGQVEVYHGFKTEDLKNGRMKDFREGKFQILLATEAAGMGCDISDIVRVVQYGYPSDINCLVQRLGRAARDGTSQGYGIFLVPKKKTVSDQDLQRFIDTPGCRRYYLNKFYGNHHIPVTKNCCDRCHPDDDDDDKDESGVVRSKSKALVQAKWDKAEGEQVRNALIEWRSEMFDLHYSGRLYSTLYTVMTDHMLDKAVKRYNSIIADGSIACLKWDPFNDDFPSQVLNTIMRLNVQFLEARRERDERQNEEKKRKQQSGKIPSFRIVPCDGATTGQQETQVVTIVSDSQQQQGNRAKEDSQKQQQGSSTGDDTQKPQQGSSTGDDTQKQQQGIITGDDTQQQQEGIITGDDIQQQQEGSITGDDTQQQQQGSSAGDDTQQQRQDIRTKEDSSPQQDKETKSLMQLLAKHQQTPSQPPPEQKTKEISGRKKRGSASKNLPPQKKESTIFRYFKPKTID